MTKGAGRGAEVRPAPLAAPKLSRPAQTPCVTYGKQKYSSSRLSGRAIYNVVLTQAILRRGGLILDAGSGYARSFYRYRRVQGR